MKVVNKKTKKEYQITDKAWENIKALGKAGAFSVMQDDVKKKFEPKELKIESKKQQ